MSDRNKPCIFFLPSQTGIKILKVKILPKIYLAGVKEGPEAGTPPTVGGSVLCVHMALLANPVKGRGGQSAKGRGIKTAGEYALGLNSCSRELSCFINQRCMQ